MEAVVWFQFLYPEFVSAVRLDLPFCLTREC